MSKIEATAIREALRALPVNERAELLVEIFRIVAGEFAAMVLEHVEAPKARRAAARIGKGVPTRRTVKRRR